MTAKVRRECRKLYCSLPRLEVLVYKTCWFFWAFVMLDIWYNISHGNCHLLSR
jgi:hypothetical protein